jgi:hypothetical protein
VVSKFAFKFNSCRYTVVRAAIAAHEKKEEGGGDDDDYSWARGDTEGLTLTKFISSVKAVKKWEERNKYSPLRIFSRGVDGEVTSL